jgi:hypothetical protein
MMTKAEVIKAIRDQIENGHVDRDWIYRTNRGYVYCTVYSQGRHLWRMDRAMHHNMDRVMQCGNALITTLPSIDIK